MTNCKILECKNKSKNGRNGICEKHYARYYRTGTYDLIKKESKRKPRKDGYLLLYKPNHPLANGNSIYEHRYVLYEAIGKSLKECALCHKPVTWKTVHVDHIDCNKSNNLIENLRPLCNVCNTRRNAKPAHTKKNALSVTYKGKTLTPHEWARELKLNITGHQLRIRLKSGMSVEDALFSPKKTHTRMVKKND